MNNIGAERKNLISMAKGAALNLSGAFVGKFFMLLFTIVMARLLPANDLGLYFLGFSMTAVASSIATLGMRMGVVRFVSIYKAREDMAAIRGTLIIGTVVVLISSTCAAAALFAAREWIAVGLLGKPRFLLIMPFFIWSIPIETCMAVLLGSTEGLKFMKYSAFVEQLLVQTGRLLYFILLVCLCDLGLAGAGLSYLLASASALFASIWFCTRHIPLFDLRQRASFRFRELMHFSLPMLPASVLFDASKQVDVLMLGWLSTEAAVGVYTIAVRLVIFTEIIYRAFQQILNPYIADLHSSRSRSQLAEIFHFSTKWCFMASLPLFVFFVLYPSFFMGLFHESMAAGGICLTILASAHLVSSLSNLAFSMIIMTGHSRLGAIDSTIFALTNVVANYFLIPRFDLVGAAMSHGIAVLVLSGLRFHQVYMLERIHPFNSTILKLFLSAIASSLPLVALSGYNEITNISNMIVFASTFLLIFIGCVAILTIDDNDRVLLLSIRTRLKAFTLFCVAILTLSAGLLTTACSGTAGASEVVWEPLPLRTEPQKMDGIRGGEGFQQIQAIAFSQINPQVVYMASDQSHIWKSADGGNSWIPSNNGFLANGARSIIVDPNNSNVVFAAGFVGKDLSEGLKLEKRHQGIYRTTDGGNSWQFLLQADFFKQESKGRLFAFDPSNVRNGTTQTIYAGTCGGGLLRSRDGGNTWVVAGLSGERIIDMVEDPSATGSLIIATESGLFRFQSGQTTALGRDLPDWPRSIGVSKNRPGHIIACLGSMGIYRSADGGLHFQKTDAGLPIFSNFTDIAVSPTSGDMVFVKSEKSFDKTVFYSHDGGASWHAPDAVDSRRLLPAGVGLWRNGPIVPHPTEPASALLGGNGKDNVFITKDGGKTWSYSGTGYSGGRMIDVAFIDSSTMIFGLTDFGLWMTRDSGDTFSELTNKPMFILRSSASCASDGSQIIASIGGWTDRRLIVSTDSGNSWRYATSVLDGYDFIAFHPQNKNVIYAGPLVSRNAGESWQRLSISIRALYSQNGDIVYGVRDLGNGQCQVLKSSDQGRTWTSSLPALPFYERQIKGFVVSPTDSDLFYLATPAGVWVSGEAGWTVRDHRHGLVKDAFGLCFISSICTDPFDGNTIYAGRESPGIGKSNGVFRSLDGGMTWESANGNLGSGLTVHSVKISPFDRKVYLGTSLGTFRSK